MESIEQMIKRLCPGGVEYVKLGDLFELRNGYTPSKGNVDFWTDGTIPWFRMEDIRANGRILNDSIQHITPSAIKGKGLFPAGSFILATTATIGEHALLTTDSLANQQFTNLSVRKTHQKDVNVKFLHHYMFIIDEWCKKNVNSSSFASVDMNKLKEYMIPIPPLSIQSRIVEVLDKMATLTAELEAELEARKQQYEYYRNKLLTFNEIEAGNRFVKLGDVCELGTGSHNTQDGLIEGLYPFYTRGIDILFLNEYDYDETAIVTAGDGAGVGKVIHFVKGKYSLHQRAYRIVADEQQVLAKYVYHYMKATFYNYIIRSSVSSSVTSVRKPMLYDYPIPIPSLSEQQRIVSILDRFEALTTDLQSGLPAEIEARRQQYEYYRNKLLTFEAV